MFVVVCASVCVHVFIWLCDIVCDVVLIDFVCVVFACVCACD